MTMKEDLDEASFDSRSFERDTAALTFGSKERYELNDTRDANLTELEAKDRDDCSNIMVMDDSSINDENGIVGSPRKEDHNGQHLIMDNGAKDFPKESKDELTHHITSWDKDADSLSSDSYDIEKEQGSPEHESLDTVEEFTECNRRDSRDSTSPLFMDKTVLECHLPELEVCYRETDCQSLKDICVDEGRPEKDVNVIESRLLPLPPNDINHIEAEEEPSLDANSFTADQYGSNEENEGKHLISQEALESSPHSSFNEVMMKHCAPENAVETSEACIDGTSKVLTDSSEDSIVNRIVSEDFGNQNSLGTAEKVVQLSNQVPNQEAVPESPASSPDAECTGKDIQTSCLAYNRKVENEIIIFNFNSPDGAVVGSGTAGDASEQSANLGDIVHKDMNAGNSRLAVNNEVDESHEQSLISIEGNSDGRSATSHTPSIISEGSSSGNSHEGSSEHNQANSNNIPIDDDGPVQPPSNKTTVAPNDACAPNHSEKDFGDMQVVNQLQQDVGETSFSAASMITYSGPIAFSGSLSHRSDGSTTSGKSFAFPVLQSEWNSSPVRMAKADRRNFRKHKGWRSGLLCCRF